MTVEVTVPKNAFTPDERPATKEDIRIVRQMIATHSVVLALMSAAAIVLGIAIVG